MTIKHVSRNPLLTRSLLAALAFTVISVSASQAQVTTETTTSAFFSQLKGPAYFEDFTSFAGSNPQVSPQAFSFGGYSFTLSDNDAIYYSTTGASSIYPGVATPSESFTITFTSGNVTAVGGNFFTTGSDFDPTAGDNVTATVNTGQSLTQLSSATYSGEPFYGFTSSVPILSITITVPNNPNGDFLTLDNLYVGASTIAAAPEPSTWALMLGGLGLLAGMAQRRLRRA